MDLLIIVSNARSGPIAQGLGAAADRAGKSWAVFFTNDGVRNLQDEKFVTTLSNAAKAIACHDSWQIHMGDQPCPVELGSQTNNSALAGEARRIVSL